MTTRLIDADELAQWLDTAASNADGAEATAYQRVARLVRAHADRTTQCPSCHTEPGRPHTDYCRAAGPVDMRVIADAFAQHAAQTAVRADDLHTYGGDSHTDITIATPAHCGRTGGLCFYPATCTLTHCEVRNGR